MMIKRTAAWTSTCQAGKGTTERKYRRRLQTSKSPQKRLGHNGSLPSPVDTNCYAIATLPFVWQTYSEGKCFCAIPAFSVIKKQ